MAFKRILAVVTGEACDAAALAAAFALARPAAGHVDALHVRPDPRDAVPMLGEGVSGGLVEQIMSVSAEAASRRAAAARETFARARDAAGLPPDGPGAAFLDRVGRAAEIVTAEARLADLAVFACAQAADHADGAPVLEAVLTGGGRPLLLAPPELPAAIGRHVAIAWNGGTEAARAVAAAMDAVTRAERVTILTAGTAKTRAGQAEGLRAYLAWHGVAAEVASVPPHADGVGAALLAAAGAAGADLLVMGGYGRSRLRELILGGVTRHVLNHARLPVLMAH